MENLVRTGVKSYDPYVTDDDVRYIVDCIKEAIRLRGFADWYVFRTIPVHFMSGFP